VDRAVIEMLAHLVDVIYSNGGRVEPWVCLEPCKAGFETRDRIVIDVGKIVVIPVVAFTVERIGAAGAPLVDQHDVPFGLKAAEERQPVRRERRRSASWSTFEDEQRVWLRNALERRRDDDLEVDRAAR